MAHNLGFPLPPVVQPPGCLVSRGFRAMEARWIPTLAGGRASFLVVLLKFGRVCVLLRKTRRWRLPKDGIRLSPPSPVPMMLLASSEGVWRFISSGSRGIWLVFVFGGSAWIQSSSIYVRVSTGRILPSHASLHWRWLLFWCACPWGLSTTTSRHLLQQGWPGFGDRGDESDTPFACSSVCSRR